MGNNRLDRWCGPFVAIVTPFDDQGRIVEDDFKTLVHSYVEDGTRGIVVAGHNGESWSLEPAEMKQLVALAKKTAGDSVPVLCGLEDRSADGVIESAKMMADAGADGIMAEPPYIVTTATDAEICDRFERIATGSPVPVMMYNNPRRTQISMKPDIVARLAKHENIVAIKEATRDFAELTLKIALAAEDIKIFVGPSPLILPGIMFGAHGFISSGPMELLRRDGARLYELAAAKDVDAALPLHFKVTTLYRALFGLGTWPAALKAAMRMLDRPVGYPRLPVHPLGPSETARLEQTLRDVGVIP